MDHSLQGSSVHGIFQARILEWVAISFSRGPFQPRDRIRVSRIASRCFTVIQLTLLEFLIDLVIFITRLWGPEGRIYIFHVLSILKTWEAQYSCLENLNGERSVVGYSPGGHKESDMTEQLSTHTYHKGIIKIVFRMNTSIFLFMWKLDIVMWTICQDARLVFEGMFRDRLTWDWVRQVGWY